MVTSYDTLQSPLQYKRKGGTKKIARLFQKENSLTKNDWIGYKNETPKGLTI